MSRRRSEPLVDLVTSRMAVLSDPTRVHILELLEEGDATVQELADQLPSTPQNISRHLGILHAAGIVACARHGRSVQYSLVDYSACRVFDQVLAGISGQIDDRSALAICADTTPRHPSRRAQQPMSMSFHNRMTPLTSSGGARTLSVSNSRLAARKEAVHWLPLVTLSPSKPIRFAGWTPSSQDYSKATSGTRPSSMYDRCQAAVATPARLP